MKNKTRIHRAKFGRDFPIPRGTRPVDALSALIGEPVEGECGPDLTLPTIWFPAGDRMWDAAERIAASIGCTLQVEKAGSHDYRVRLVAAAQ